MFTWMSQNITLEVTKAKCINALHCFPSPQLTPNISRSHPLPVPWVSVKEITIQSITQVRIWRPSLTPSSHPLCNSITISGQLYLLNISVNFFHSLSLSLSVSPASVLQWAPKCSCWIHSCHIKSFFYVASRTFLVFLFVYILFLSTHLIFPPAWNSSLLLV